MGLTAVTQSGESRVCLDDGEEIRHIQPQMSIVLGNRTPEQPGTLYITTRRLMWLSDSDKHKGYGVDFISISLHAVSRDPEAYPLPCIYTQIESIETDSSGDEDEETDLGNNEDLDLSRVTEMRLIPSDSSTLDNIFKVLCECAELNPEPYGEQEGEGDWVFNTEEMTDLDPAAEEDGEGDWGLYEEEMGNPIGYSNGLREHNIAHNILELRIDDECFEDAEEMEHVSHDLNNKN